MSQAKTSEALRELKQNLWAKIQYLEERMIKEKESDEDYRKVLDAYHKLVKSYLDIIKVQAYAPGGVDPTENDLANLLSRLKSGEELRPEDKQALQMFKRALDLLSKEECSR